MEEQEMIPAGPVRNSVVGLIGLMDHARKYCWSEDKSIAEFLVKVNEVISELADQLPENKNKGTVSPPE